MTGAGGGGVDDNVEQLAFTDANKGVQTLAALLFLVHTIIDMGIDIVSWSLFSPNFKAWIVAEHQSYKIDTAAAGTVHLAGVAPTSPSFGGERKDLGPDLLKILDPNPVRHNTLHALSRFDFD